MQAKANTSIYVLSDMGLLNGDCCDTGDGISNKDALAIQQFLLGTIQTIPTLSKN